MSERATTTVLRRRWRRSVLRAQGVLDGDQADRYLPWALAALTFVVFLALDAAAIRSLEGGSGLGPWLQAAWRREHGMDGTPLGGVDPASGSWSLISEPILLLARILPAVAVFTTVQAAAIALGIVPLWRIAREQAHLRVGATLAITTAYVLAPTLHRTNLGAFHPEAIALPALLWAYLEGVRGHWARYSALVAVVLACRADLGLTVAALGALFFLLGHRRAGAITAAVGVAWTGLAIAIADPQVPEGSLTPSGEFVARATTPLAIVGELVTDPITQVRLLLSEPSVLFLVVVLAPLLFLPLVSPRKLAPALACLVLAMIADTQVQEVAQRGVIDLAPAGAHVAPAMAFVFLALVFALERIGTRSVTRINVDRRVLLALVAGAVLFFLTAAPSSLYRQPWSWGSQDASDGARLEAVDEAGERSHLAASPSLTALVAARPEVTELPLDPDDLDAARIAEVGAQVDEVLLDTNGRRPLTGAELWQPDEQQRVLDRFAEAGFEVAYAAEGVYLLVAAEGQASTTDG